MSANTILEAAGLRVGTVTEDSNYESYGYAEAPAVGTVMEQLPLGDAVVPIGTSVNLTVYTESV